MRGFDDFVALQLDVIEQITPQRLDTVRLQEGTLVLDLRDPSTKSLVWRGIARAAGHL